MAYCKNCGQFIPDNATHCSNCGVSNKQPQPQAQYQSYQQSYQNQQNSGYQQPNQNQYQQYQQPNPYQQQYSQPQNKINDIINKITNTEDHTQEFNQQDINDNFAFALLSYIGILFLIPLFARKDSKFCRFHINNGIILFAVEFVTGIVSTILHSIIKGIFSHDVLFAGIYYSELNGFGKFLSGIVTLIISLIMLVCFALAIMGIINAVQRRAKDLPLISKFKFFK